MSVGEQSPDLPTVLAGALRAHMKGVRVALPGRVETYDPTTQSCSVQPLIFDGVPDETGTRQPDRIAVVENVPVVFPGSGAFSITFPISKGDTVLLVVSSSSIDRWLAIGGEVDPIDDRRHHITDAIAIPGLRDFPHAISPAPSTTAMAITANDLRLGAATASDPVALKSDLTQLKAAIISATIALGAGGAAAIATAADVNAGGTWPNCATKIKGV